MDSTLGSVPDGGLTKNGAGCLILVSIQLHRQTTINAAHGPEHASRWFQPGLRRAGLS